MKNKNFLTSNKASCVAVMSLFAAFAGCVVEPSSGYRGHVEVEADFQDDYDYYPEYETYYSCNRHEFVYLDGGIWVRRREPPRGISVNVILAASAVRLDFHDAPQRHHSTVIRSYPRTWRRPDTDRSVRQERPNDPPERHDFRPEQRPEVRRTEPHETTPKRPSIQPAPAAEPKPEPRANKPKPQKKKVAPKEEHPDNKPEDKKDDRKDDRKDDKHDTRGPKRLGN